VGFFIAQPIDAYWGQILNAFNQDLIGNFDMTLGYRTPQWPSDRVKALMYHEFAHAAHFNKVGQAWWNEFVYAVSFTIGSNPPNLEPYGDGNDGIISDYISVAESWAEHLGRTMTDMQYGGTSTGFREQGVDYFNNTPVFGLSSHLNWLEDFSPFRINDDPFAWIPVGLYRDLIDDRNDATAVPLRVFLNDFVLGFTNQQLFNALDNDVTSIQLYRQRLIGENPNNQTAAVNQLFTEYGF